MIKQVDEWVRTQKKTINKAKILNNYVEIKLIERKQKKKRRHSNFFV